MSSEKFDLKENDLQLSDFSNGVQNENMETIVKDKTFNQNIDNSIENNLENGLNDESNSNSDQQIANNFNTNDQLNDKTNENEKLLTTDCNKEEIETTSEEVSDDNGCYCDEEITSQDNSLNENSAQFAQQFSVDKQFVSFDQNARDLSSVPLPDTVTILDGPNGAKVYLVGTAHFSQKSQQDVSLTIRRTQPNIVVLELCESRLSILSFDEKSIMEESKTMGIAKMRRNIQEFGLVQGVMYMLLLSLSAHLTKELGMAPGGEFRTAFHEANRVPGCVVHLGDRPVHITLRRAISSLSVWQKLKLAFGIIFNNETISKEEVEKCKQKDLLEEMLAEMTGEFPALSNVFVRERDTYLAYSLWLAASPIPNMNSLSGTPLMPAVVVGVVGIGHVPGIVKQWGTVTNEDIPPLLKLPETSLTSKIIRKSVKYSVIGLVIWGSYKLLIPISIKTALTHATLETIDWIHKSIKS